MSQSDDARQWEKIDALCESLGKVQSDVAYIKGKLEATTPKQDGYNIASKQNALTLALAGLISVVAAAIGKVTGSN